MKSHPRIFYWCLSAGLLLTSVSGAADPSTSKFSREFLLKKSTTLPSESIETRVIRVTFPKGYKTPTHTHEGQGPRYVLKGKLKVVDGGETKEYGQGDVFWETGTEMTVENVGGGEASMVIFEMAPPKAQNH